MTTLLFIFGISLVSCLILSPLVRALAKRWDLVDRPDGKRKVHSQETPLGGGLAIFASAVTAVFFAWAASPLHDRLEANGLWLIGLLLASALISGVGLV